MYLYLATDGRMSPGSLPQTRGKPIKAVCFEAQTIYYRMAAWGYCIYPYRLTKDEAYGFGLTEAYLSPRFLEQYYWKLHELDRDEDGVLNASEIDMSDENLDRVFRDCVIPLRPIHYELFRVYEANFTGR